MIKRIYRRVTREPVICIAAILFAVTLSLILCYLRQSGQEEQKNYEITFHSIPVEFEITTLNGSRLDQTASIDGYFADLFFKGSVFEPNFSGLVTDMQLRMRHEAILLEKQRLTEQLPEIAPQNHEVMVGITSLRVAEELTPEYGGIIEWYNGFNESVFGSDQFVCVVPSDFSDTETVALSFQYKSIEDKIDKEYTCTFQIVGRYMDEGNGKLYCPYSVLEKIYRKLSEPRRVQCIMGRLGSNDNLQLLRETANAWFAEPNPMGNPTPWGKFGNEYYPYAMDIKDTMLKNLVTDMQNSMSINRIAAGLIFVISAGAGFLTGFLVIRSRKREIALMRTLGTSNGIIWMELEIEQMLCMITGVIIGGSYLRWEPWGQLCILAGTYIAGLTVALLAFLRSNLLVTMKEDE